MFLYARNPPQPGCWYVGRDYNPTIKLNFKTTVGKGFALIYQRKRMHKEVIYGGAGVAQAMRRTIPEQAWLIETVLDKAGSTDKNVAAIAADAGNGK